MTIAQAIAKRTIELLDDKKMTQYRLAEDMAVGQGTVSRIVNAVHKAVNLKTVFLMCGAFNISIVQFFDSPLFVGNEQLDVE